MGKAGLLAGINNSLNNSTFRLKVIIFFFEFRISQNYLKQKNFVPYQTTDGRYRGYVYWYEDGKKKRKPLSSVDMSSLIMKALDFYKSTDPFFNNKPLNLEKLYPLFIDDLIEDGTYEGTIAHNEYDWKRYLVEDGIIKKPLKDLTYVEFNKWFKRKLRGGLLNKKTGETLPFTTKQAKALRSILSLLFQFAVDNGYAQENLSKKMGKFPYKKYCVDKHKLDSEQVYQDDEPTRLMNLAYEKFNETKNFAYLAVILNFMLDLRVGELVALKYSDLDDKPGQIHIQRQEIVSHSFNKKKKRMERQGYTIVEHTKTWEDRYVNLSDTAINLISLIQSEQKKLGIESEFLFINKRGDRMHHNSVDRVMRTVLNPGIGSSQKSCHGIRKTVTSEIRNELGVAVAARVAGHKNESTTDLHYSFSTRSNENYKEEYTRVIDMKVPEFLKEAHS